MRDLLLLAQHGQQLPQILVYRVDDFVGLLQLVGLFLGESVPVEGAVVPELLDLVEVLLDLGLRTRNVHDVVDLLRVLL